MKTRTVILAVEIDGLIPDALSLSRELIGRPAGRHAEVVDVRILDDGIGPDDEVKRRQAPLTGN